MRNVREALEMAKLFPSEIIDQIILKEGFFLKSKYYFSLTVEIDEKNDFWPVFLILTTKENKPFVLARIPLDQKILLEGYLSIIPLEQNISVYEFMCKGTPFMCEQISSMFVARADYLTAGINYNDKGASYLTVVFLFSKGRVFMGSIPYERVKEFILKRT